MPYYASSQEWLKQSQLLLEANPTTTRITTKYHVWQPKPRKPKPTTAGEAAPAAAAAAPSEPRAARGRLVLKTYDPPTGVTLKYKTTKAAEVSRLVLSLGRLSRPMAGLPEIRDEIMADAPPAEAPAVGGGGGVATPAAEKGGEGGAATVAGVSAGGKPNAPAVGGGGGGKGKKKKGKK